MNQGYTPDGDTSAGSPSVDRPASNDDSIDPPVVSNNSFFQLPPLPISGAMRRESALPLVDEATATRSGKTSSRVIVYRHAENKKKKKNTGIKKNAMPGIDDGFRGVDDSRPGFIDAKLLKENADFY